MVYKDFNYTYQCIFIHVPKSAGISIETALFGDKAGHHTALEYLNENQEVFYRFFKFGFVRNPYTRLASAYFYLKNGGRNKFDKQWALKNLLEINEFREFVILLQDTGYRKKVLNWVHFRQQNQFLCDTKNNVIVDYVGKFEQLEKDFDIVCKKLGVNRKLPTLNETNKSENYFDYYDDLMQKIVSEIYYADFKLFGYSTEIDYL